MGKTRFCSPGLSDVELVPCQGGPSGLGILKVSGDPSHPAAWHQESLQCLEVRLRPALSTEGRPRGSAPGFPAVSRRRLEVRQVPGQVRLEKSAQGAERPAWLTGPHSSPQEAQGMSDGSSLPSDLRRRASGGEGGTYLPAAPGRKRRGARQPASRRGWQDGPWGASALRGEEAPAQGSQAAPDSGGPAGVLRRSREGPAPPSALARARPPGLLIVERRGAHS